MMIRVVFILLFLASFISCVEEPTCINPDNDYVQVEFKSIENGTSLGIKVDSVYQVEQAQSFYIGDSLSTMAIPLSPFENQSTFIFSTEFGKDTILIQYNALPKLYGTSCDVIILYEDLESSINTFDSVYFDFQQIPPYAEIYY